MILFYGEGRLGNQIFQYQALSHVAKPGERVLAVGLEDLERSLDLGGARLTVLTRNGVLKRIVKYAMRPLLLRPLSRTLRLFNYAFEERSGIPPRAGASGELSVRRGLLRGLTFVDGGYYQNSSFWSCLFPAASVRIKQPLREVARTYLTSVCGAKQRACFVHVRRCDYLTHTDYGLRDLSLPADYYHAATRELERRLGNTHFVFVTDDPAWVEETFRGIADKSIASFDAPMDFAIMTQCACGILSNSTFSLAAALMMTDPEVVIAPEYWLGFRIREWLPPKIRYRHSKLSYLPVGA